MLKRTEENQWLDAQRKKTDDLMEVHLRLVTRSTASMADSVEKVKKVGGGSRHGWVGGLRSSAEVLTSLVQEIAEGVGSTRHFLQ